MIHKTDKTLETGKTQGTGGEDYETYYGNDAAYDSEAYGDFDLGEGEEAGEPAGPIDSNSVYREIEDLRTMAKGQGASADWLKQLEAKKTLVMQSASLSPEKRQEILASIRAELESMQEGLATDLEAAPARDELKKELQDLRKELGSETLDEETKKSLVEKCTDAEQALAKHDVEGASELYSEAKEGFEDAKTSAAETAKEKADERKATAKDLKDRIDHSTIPDDKKAGLKKRLEDLEKSWEGQEVDDDKVKEDLQAIEKDLKREKKVADLRQSFAGFSAKIPSFADSNLTYDLAEKFRKGIDTGDWSSFLAKLKDKNLDQDNLYHGVRQLVGTMFWSLAGGDEHKLELLLDLIPTDVRQAMIDVIMPKYADNNHWSSNPQERQSHGLYGGGKETAGRLQESMAKDDIQAELDSEAPSA